MISQAGRFSILTAGYAKQKKDSNIGQANEGKSVTNSVNLYEIRETDRTS